MKTYNEIYLSVQRFENNRIPELRNIISLFIFNNQEYLYLITSKSFQPERLLVHLHLAFRPNVTYSLEVISKLVIDYITKEINV